MRKQLLTIAIAAVASFVANANDPTHWKEDFAYMMGKQAYIYGFPALKTATVRHQWIEGKQSTFSSKGNQFTHYRQLVDPSYQYGTSMNRDTLYSLAFSYVGDEPLVFTYPENTDGRYFSLEFTEWYTDAIDYISKRTVGNKAASYLVHNKGWKGKVPQGIDKAIESPTPWILAVGRTYTSNTKEDLVEAHKIQDGYKIYTLSQWNKVNPKQATPISDVLNAYPKNDPLAAMKTMSASMQENPPPKRDEALMKQFALVNIGPLAQGTIDDLDKHSRKGLIRATKDAQVYLQKVSQAVGSITNQNKIVNGWKYNPNNWCRMAADGDFLGRSATQALSGGIENCVEEAVKLRTFTDENNQLLSGSKKYKLTFSKEQIPQVNAFWSITLYDNNFNLVRTKTDKFAIRDIDKDIVYEKDGSLVIYLQSTPPKKANVNWLPTPKNNVFNLFFRAYLPNESFIRQEYVPPQIKINQ